MSDHPDDFKTFDLGFSMFERAWTMRGMENLLADVIEEPDFVDELLDAIAEYRGSYPLCPGRCAACEYHGNAESL